MSFVLLAWASAAQSQEISATKDGVGLTLSENFRLTADSLEIREDDALIQGNVRIQGEGLSLSTQALHLKKLDIGTPDSWLIQADSRTKFTYDSPIRSSEGEADKLQLTISPAPKQGESRPTTIELSGNVFFRDNDRVLRAGSISYDTRKGIVRVEAEEPAP